MRRGEIVYRPRVSAATLVLALASLLFGCLGDGPSPDEGGTATPTETGSEATASSILSELSGWELTFLAVRGGNAPHLYSANADGSNVRQLDRFPGDKQTPNWAPNGRRLAVRWVPSDYDNPTPLLVLASDGSIAVNLTKRTGLAGWSPSWSPDGKRLVTAARTKFDRTEGLYVMNSDGTNARRITPPGREAQYASWSPSAEKIAFTYVEDGGFDLYTIRPDGSDLRRLTSDGPEGENNWAMWSPDGAKIAWGRGETLWLMKADGSGQRMVTDAGSVPGAWAPGPFITFQCKTQAGIGICAVHEDGTGLVPLLGGIDAGFPAWRPRQGG